MASLAFAEGWRQVGGRRLVAEGFEVLGLAGTLDGFGIVGVFLEGDAAVSLVGNSWALFI